jgi:hypothetical protein
MIAGLSFRVLSLFLLMAMCADFALHIRKLPAPEKNEQLESTRRTRLFRGFFLEDSTLLKPSVQESKLNT